jgi:cell division protein FtsB
MHLRRYLPVVWRRLKRARWAALLGCGLAVYFIYHAIEGSRGWFAFRDLGQELEEAEGELDRLTAQRLELSARIQGLSDQSLDPDLLDELVRRRLSFAAPEDVIILLEPAQTRP